MTLSCRVTVDVIHTIGITTTTKTLFVDAEPAQMAVEAFNKEGNDVPNDACGKYA